MHFKLVEIDKHRKAVIILLIALSACLIVGGIYAFFSAYINNAALVGTGNIYLELIQSPPFNADVPDAGANTNVNNFRIKSNSTIDVMLRLKVLPVVEYYDDEESSWVVAPIPNQNITMSTYGDNWSGSIPEFYYNNPLMPGETTSDFNVEIVDIIIPEGYNDKQIRTKIKLIVEAGQSNNNLYQSIFEI